MCGALEDSISTNLGVGEVVGKGVGLGVRGAVGIRVGNRVGSFVRGAFVGFGVTFCVGDGSMSHGVFGKQAKPEGHSDDDPLMRK